jgi:site-specific DNA recombinase
MNVLIYARVSSESQDVDLSISAQLRALREFAQSNGHLIVKELVDEAESGRTAARPKFKEMISLARRQPRVFDAILVWKYSRFARNREDSVVFKALLRRCGVDVVSITEPHDNTATGKLMEAFIEGLDEFYSQNLGEEVTRGMRESAMRGFYLSARKPYGYRKVRVRDGNKERTKLEIEDSEASVVTQIFKSVLEGNGLTEIAKNLNGRAIPSPRGKGWGKTGLREIVSNELCTGTFVWGRNSKRGLEPIRTEGACPAIIDQATFEKARTIMRERAPANTHPKRVASRFLLSGIARCGHCGKALVAQIAKSGQFSYYICGTLNKKGAGSCPSRYLNTNKFERLIVEKLKERILTPENLTQMVELANTEIDEASTTHQQERDLVISELADTGRRLDKLYDVIERGALDMSDLAPRVKEIRSRQDALLQRKAEIQALMAEKRIPPASIATVRADVEDMHALLSEGTLAERRAFVRDLVKEVRVTGDEVLVTYSPPFPEERLSAAGAGVLPTERYGGRYRTRTCDLTDVNRVL